MTTPPISSAFTRVYDAAKARANEKETKLQEELQALLTEAERTISELKREMQGLTGRITLLEGQIKRNKLTGEAEKKALCLERDQERTLRLQAERERDYLLEVFTKRKGWVGDSFPESNREFVSPYTFEIHKNQWQEIKNEWDEDWEGYLKIIPSE